VGSRQVGSKLVGSKLVAQPTSTPATPNARKNGAVGGQGDKEHGGEDDDLDKGDVGEVWRNEFGGEPGHVVHGTGRRAVQTGLHSGDLLCLQPAQSAQPRTQISSFR